MKKSPVSMLLLLALLVIGGYVTYRYVIQPWMKKRIIEKAVEEGCADVVKKFEKQKQEIAEDLAKLIDKITDSEEEQLHDMAQSEQDLIDQK